jgi:5-guanidino-2-oxopentanoate decarboxylase
MSVAGAQSLDRALNDRRGSVDEWITDTQHDDILAPLVRRDGGVVRDPCIGAVFSDMTQIAYLGNYAFGTDRPGLWHHPSGYGTLGYALPAAIGAKLGAPERAMVALAGDFGLQFTLQELVTAVEAQCSLPIVLWNNSALGQIRDDMAAAGITPIAVSARNPDFMALAAAYGAHALQVRSPDALAQGLRAALRHRGPTLIEAIEADFLAH